MKRQRPLVKSMNSGVARILIVCQVCFIIVHTAEYSISLLLWNLGSGYTIVMYLLEELPNLFNLIITITTLIDPLLPQNIYVDNS
jgi:hypothetical protein